MIEIKPAYALALAAALSLALAAALVAGASAKLVERTSRSGELSVGSDGRTKAECPKRGRRHLISGGFINDSPFLDGAQSTIAFFDSRPAARRGWRVGAANFAGDTETVRARALCSKENPEVVVRRGEVRIGPAGSDSLRVGCPSGHEAIAGGFRAKGFAQDQGPELIATESRRQGPRRWRFSAYNNSGTNGGKLIGIVRCADRRPGLVSHKVKGEAFDRSPVELRARCEEGERLWSGGFRGEFGSFDPFAVLLADASYPDGRKWVSRFVGYQSRGKVTAYAYCRPV